MKTYYTYIAECSDKSYYTGVTNNLESRIDQHNSGGDPTAYTYSRRPVVLKYAEEFNDVTAAIAREKQLKRWSRKKKEALISFNDEKLVFYSKRIGMQRK